MTPLNVLMVSTSYPAGSADWRGLFIRRLTEALADRKDLTVSLWSPPGEVPAAIRRVCSPLDDHWFAQLIHLGGIAQLLRRRPLRGLVFAVGLLKRLRALYQRHPTDIYHINWLQNALPLPPNGRPALITVLGADMRLLALPGMAKLMRRVCHGRRVAICPNADWMVPRLQRVFGDDAIVTPVAFGIDPSWFEMERRFTSEPIPQWLAVARITRDKIGELFAWGESVFRNRPRQLHLFGPMVEPVSLPDWVIHHGPVTPHDLRQRWFPVAHGFVTLSRHSEGRPQVMLEAMAAGLPIVASRLSAHDDLLRHGETGWLINSAQEFADGISALESPELNRAIGLAARVHVQQEVGTWADCAARYVAMYNQLTGAG